MEPCPQSEILLSLIQQRLHFMQEIASYKYQHHLPIYVPEVEKINAEILKKQVNEEALPAIEMDAFLENLIALSRQVQEAWFKKYQLEMSQPKIESELAFFRQEVMRVTLSLITQTKLALRELKDPACTQTLDILIEEKINLPFVSEAQKQILLQSLRAVANKGAP